MEYEWNPDKAESNQIKHGVRFADAVAVLSDPAARTMLDVFADEERFLTLGMNAFGDLLVVVYVWKDETTIRLISARKATRSERRTYAEEEHAG
jgi:uncharacterized DUF497 family protein